MSELFTTTRSLVRVPVRSRLLLLAGVMTLLLLAACGGEAATPTPVGPVATPTSASGEQAVLDRYTAALRDQKWDEAVALFSTDIDAAARDQFVADMTDFVASGGIPTQVVVEDVVTNGDTTTATVKIRNIAATLTQKITLVKSGDDWVIQSIES